AMANIQELTDQLASAALMADVEDLPSLAKIHETLGKFSECVAADAAVEQGVKANATRTAGEAGKLLERILLRDVEDAAAALTSISSQIEQLQQILTGAAPILPAAAPTVSPAPSQSEASAGASSEGQWKAEDLPLIADFITEADGHIESAEAALLELGNNPT